ALGEDCRGVRARATIHADGAVIVPGFNDAHAHSVWFGTTLLEVDLAGCDDLGEVYARIAGGAQTQTSSAWVTASGYNQMDTGGQYPDPRELDRASGGRPVWIKHTSGHSCIISAEALKILGITGRENVDGGRVVVDAD